MFLELEVSHLGEPEQLPPQMKQASEGAAFDLSKVRFFKSRGGCCFLAGVSCSDHARTHHKKAPSQQSTAHQSVSGMFPPLEWRCSGRAAQAPVTVPTNTRSIITDPLTRSTPQWVLHTGPRLISPNEVEPAACRPGRRGLVLAPAALKYVMVRVEVETKFRNLGSPATAGDKL